MSATRSGTATSFLYGGWEVLQEQQGGTSSADVIVGLGTDERFARSGSTYLVDALGSTVALAASGVVQTNTGYDPYGVATVTGTASTNPFQFTGREADGTGLLNYRNRYYNPAWGRFVSEDPIRLAGGTNVYAYANADPTDLRDPLGLLPIGSIGTPSTGPSAGPAAPDGTSIDLAGKKRPNYYCQNVTCGAPTGGTYYPLCPQFNYKLGNGGGNITLENGTILTQPIPLLD